MAAADETILAAPAADSSQQDTEDDILDASDLSDLPTVKKSVHGEWLRSANRPFQPVRCWLSSNPESVEALKRDASALVRTHGLGGRTFWMGVDEEPRCLLERFALEVLRFHSTTEDTFIGAEWWVQMRSCGGDADGSSIAFHFDCDEGIFSATGELVPPWLSTITYLGDGGAPTLILPAVPDDQGEACSEGQGAYLSYPLCGKHLAFNGRLLHGCPHVLSLPHQGGGGDGLRLTLLVNLWRGHTPISPKRLVERVALAMGQEEEVLWIAFSRKSGARVDGECAPLSCVDDEVVEEHVFAPSESRKRLSPAARDVRQRALPSAAALAAAGRRARASCMRAKAVVVL